MAEVIPLTAERIVNLTGLNGSLKSNPLWVPHHTAAIAELERYLYPEYYDYLESVIAKHTRLTKLLSVKWQPLNVFNFARELGFSFSFCISKLISLKILRES